MKKGMIFLAIIAATLLFIPNNAKSTLQTLNWGPLAGCGTWDENTDGKSTSMTFNDDFSQFTVKCGSDQTLCYRLIQNCEIGKWQIEYGVLGVPSENDQTYHGYWDPVHNIPVVEQIP